MVGWVAALVWAGTVAQAGAPAFLKQGGTVEVQLLSDASAGVPGGTVELAVHFKIDAEWHIYWRNRGEGGLDTVLEWTVPEGARVDSVRFPAPTRHVDASDTHTFILEGEPVILATLHVPPDARPGQDLTVGLSAHWLVCKEVCKTGDKRLSLGVPIVATPAEARPANEALFKRARSEMPLPQGQAKYLQQLSAVPSVDAVKPGAEFKVAVIADVAADHHINAHKPLDEFLVPTDVFNEGTEGLEFERPLFPPAIVEDGLVPGEKAAVYRGRTVIVLPVKASGSLEGDSLRIAGVITYQACSDKSKQCFPPSAAEWSLTVPVAGPDAVVRAAHEAIFAQASTGQPATAPAVASTGQGGSGGSVTVLPPAPSVSGSWLGRIQKALTDLGLAGYLILAFAGGFILNLMPCVLPVISIKVLSFVNQARESRVRVFTLGLAFSSGILLSFVALGVLIVMLGQQWGGLFQMPQVVIGLAAVVTAFSLSLFGVFALFPPRIVNELGDLVHQEGHLSAFGMGLLATLLGTACTAPFLSVAIALASQQTPAVGMLVFVVAGIGMAFPYVLLAAKPAWLKLLPKPGPWMATFEQVMGFALLATVAWLLNTVAEQLGAQGLLWTLIFLLFVSMGVWIRGKVNLNDPVAVKIGHNAAAVLLIAVGWFFSFRGMTSIPALIEHQREIRLAATADWLRPPDWDAPRFPWIEYTPERVNQAVRAGRTVFIDYTAEWCAICKTNEKVVIDTAEIRAAMKRLGVLPFRADFTLRDPSIKADLERYGRSGVPMYVVKPANRPDDVILLDEVLTKGSLIEALEAAGSRESEQRTANREQGSP